MKLNKRKLTTEQTGNEIISGVRCLWREWRGICSNIWEVIRCESPTCVLQKPCFSSHPYKTASWRGVKVGKAACMSSRGWKHRRSERDAERLLCSTSSFSLSVSLTAANLDCMGHNQNKRRNNNLWISESKKSGFLYYCCPLSYPPKLISIIPRAPVALIVQYRSFSSSSPPLLAVSPHIPETSEQYSGSSPLYTLSPVL